MSPSSTASATSSAPQRSPRESHYLMATCGTMPRHTRSRPPSTQCGGRISQTTGAKDSRYLMQDCKFLECLCLGLSVCMSVCVLTSLYVCLSLFLSVHGNISQPCHHLTLCYDMPHTHHQTQYSVSYVTPVLLCDPVFIASYSLSFGGLSRTFLDLPLFIHYYYCYHYSYY